MPDPPTGGGELVQRRSGILLGTQPGDELFVVQGGAQRCGQVTLRLLALLGLDGSGPGGGVGACASAAVGAAARAMAKSAVRRMGTPN